MHHTHRLSGTYPSKITKKKNPRKKSKQYVQYTCMHRIVCMRYIHTRTGTTDTYTHGQTHTCIHSCIKKSSQHTRTHTRPPLQGALGRLTLPPTHSIHTQTRTKIRASAIDEISPRTPSTTHKASEHRENTIRKPTQMHPPTHTHVHSHTHTHTCLRISSVTGNFLPPSTAAMANPNDPAIERARVVLLARAFVSASAFL